MKNLITILALFLVFSCSKNSTSSGSNVDIEWLSGQSLTYRYSSGILVGGTWYNKFEVTNGSGDVHFKVYVNGDKRETKTVSVQEGLKYSVGVSVSFGSCGNSSSTAKLSTTSASDPRQLILDCPDIGIGEIGVLEITD